MASGDVNYLDGEGLRRASDRIHAVGRRFRQLASHSAVSMMSGQAFDRSTYGEGKNADKFADDFLPRLQRFVEGVQDLPEQVEEAARGVGNMSKVAFRTDEANREEGEGLHLGIAGNSYSDAGRTGDVNVSDGPVFSADPVGGDGGGDGGVGNSGGTSGRR